MPHPNTLVADVLVVGAGPSGLALAAELQLRGISAVLVDREESATKESRALGLTIGALEYLLARGQIDKFGELQGRDQVHFAGFPLSTAEISSELSPAIEIPQYRTEAVLAAWFEELGGTVTRGWELTDFVQNADSVVSILSDGGDNQLEVKSKFIVGCDGAKSAVRSIAGLDFEISTPSVQMLLGDFLETDLPDNPFGKRADGGMVMSGPIGNGAMRVIVAEFGAPLLERGKKLTGEEIADAYERVLGERFAWKSLHWGSSFTDASGAADELIDGRAILIGDAAHIHLPAGGQGMNVSILDAASLGWRLALAVHDDSPQLLRTFETERIASARALITNTQAQGQLFLRGAEVDSLRSVFATFLTEPRSARKLARAVSSVDVKHNFEYAPDDEALGWQALSGNFPALPWKEKAAGLQKHGDWLFVSTDEPNTEQGAALERAGIRRLQTETIFCDTELERQGRTAVLLRPDGVIAWTDRSQIPIDIALDHWTTGNDRN